MNPEDTALLEGLRAAGKALADTLHALYTSGFTADPEFEDGLYAMVRDEGLAGFCLAQRALRDRGWPAEWQLHLDAWVAARFADLDTTAVRVAG